ncbi:MAG: threonine synthase [Dissulfuribacterales bacterium]
MKYISTRGGIASINFEDTVMMGLATDGGLLLPQTIPTVTTETLQEWSQFDYADLAFQIIRLFATDIPEKDLRKLIDTSYTFFDTPEVTPLISADDLHILELFHGPTLAFKDIALQFLGNLFAYILEKRGGRLNILGATSGDTGSAAIYGVKGKKNINIFILHPHNRVSPIQALQMTTVPDANVFNIAIEGTFDDCQAIVKTIFNDLKFKEKHQLGAVNSINWARVMAQVVYYIYACLRLGGTPSNPVHFAVPTGNFGDIFAGYIAKRMLQGRIGKLILATNENDILARFLTEGRYKKARQVIPTISPSMDIQIASNFERYMYYLMNESGERVKEAMSDFERQGEIVFNTEQMAMARNDMTTLAVNQGLTTQTIGDFYRKTGYILDPHTAVGVAAAMVHRGHLQGHIVCLATAHPAKFANAVKEATGMEPSRPAVLNGIEAKPQRLTVMPCSVNEIKAFVQQHAL